MVAFTRALNADATGLSAILANMSATLKVWKDRADGRRELAELSFREIQDIGLDQALIAQEIAKPFWKA